MYRFKLSYEFEELFIRGLYSHASAFKKIEPYLDEYDGSDQKSILEISIEEGYSPDDFMDKYFHNMTKSEKEMMLNIQVEYVNENPYDLLEEEF